MRLTLLLVTVLHGADWSSLTEQGIALHRNGQYREAEAKFEQARELAKEFPGEDPRRWRSLANVASLAYVRGDYGRAKQLYTKLLAAPAPSEVDRAKALSVMALLLRTKGQLDDAERTACEVSRILSVEAPHSRELANALHIRAEIQRHRRNFAESARLLEEASSIVAQAVTPDVLEGMILQSRASLLRDQGRLEAAEEPQRRAVERFESLLGPRHPMTITGVSNHGQILFALGRTAEALPLMERALDVSEAELGPSHPNVAAAANNLAQAYRSTNRLAEADTLYRKAIMIWEQSLGADHPDVAKGWKNLGDLYRQQGKLRGAESLYLRARRILEHTYGPAHPLTEEVRAALKSVYLESGRKTEARRAGMALAGQ